MSITQFTMEDVRCFRERQTLEIRPLTFLVGENSTGKTTALACFQVLANYLRGEGVDFNADPYSMGIFKDIVRNSRPKAKTFKLGFATDAIELVIEFSEKTGGIEPAISSLNLKLSDGEIVFKIGGDSTERGNRLVDFDEKHNYYEINCNAAFLEIFHSSPLFAFLLFGSDGNLEGNAEGKTALANYVKTLQNLQKEQYNSWDIGDHLSVFSTSPIRSRPKRTYDPTREFDDPEGSDVPMYLMRIEATEKKNWEALKTQLVEFGRNSGLFENIDVKNFGRSLGAPFQLQVKVRGPKANITDVGYGVSQILPILVQILNPSISKNAQGNPKQSIFSLLQQPEIHLHPRAQAEFSSLLVKLANEGDQSFIIETHSDYMLDRARIEIIRGNIRPQDVSLIYFEPKGNIVKVHNISFDKMANMVGVPPHYGEFFLKESKRLLGFKD
ncbi:MAG: AAA family ATPase [Candidatus Poribacteria bacterium]|nr:AAA family ATPase [Candidatus Poribacteria bacterium]